MSNVYDVKADVLIDEISDELAKIPEMNPPSWSRFVKTAVYKERPPVDSDWWYVRAAAILRKIYMTGPIGTAKLRTKYGGKKRNGYKPAHFGKASGNIIRKMLQGLEKSGLVMQTTKSGHKGRIATAKGKSMLDKAASAIAQKKQVS